MTFFYIIFFHLSGLVCTGSQREEVITNHRAAEGPHGFRDFGDHRLADTTPDEQTGADRRCTEADAEIFNQDDTEVNRTQPPEGRSACEDQNDGVMSMKVPTNSSRLMVNRIITGFSESRSSVTLTVCEILAMVMIQLMPKLAQTSTVSKKHIDRRNLEASVVVKIPE